MVYRVLEVAPFFQRIDTFTCQGTPVIFRGDTLNKTDTYTFLSSRPGVCDSMWQLHLTVGENYITYLDTVLCPDESMDWFGDNLTSTGTYQHMIMASNGCDSMLEMSLTILDEVASDVEMVSEISCFGMADAVARVHTSASGARVIWPDNYEGNERGGLDTGRYDLRIVNGPGCTSSFSFTVDQPAPLSFEVDKKDANCQDANSGSIEILEMSGGTGHLQVWVNGALRPPINGIINGLTAGNYLVDLVDENGCTVSSTLDIEQVVAGTLDLSATDVEIVEGDSVVLRLRTQGIDSLVLIDWYGPNATCFDCDTWTVYPREGVSVYQVYAVDDKDCEYEASIRIEAQSQFYVPNAFSPNGDDLNDYFTLFSDRSVASIQSFQIFDRWGEMVHHACDVAPGQAEGAWDGTFRGRSLPPGVYVYRMEVLDKSGDRHFKYGEVTLIR